MLNAAKQADARVFGDVGFYWLPRLQELARSVPDLRVIHLYRPTDQVVRSFMRRLGDAKRLGEGGEGWTSRFPVVRGWDRQDPEVTWRWYVEDYHRQAGLLGHELDVLHIGTNDLNDDEALSRMFDFVGIPVDDRVYLPAEARHVNKGRKPKMRARKRGAA